jgi:uncharacterized membrane protein YphA (DoxX/SURF4 family)
MDFAGAISARSATDDIWMTPMSDVTLPRKQAIAAWFLQGLLALAFAAAAVAKFLGVAMMVMVFDQIGLGQWFRYVTATVEMAGVIALLLPGFAGPGALWLAITMVFAILTHLFVLHSNPGGAVVLTVLSLTLVWLRRGQFATLRARFVGASQ